MQRPWGRKSFQGGLRYSEPGADGTRQSWRCRQSQTAQGLVGQVRSLDFILRAAGSHGMALSRSIM